MLIQIVNGQLYFCILSQKTKKEDIIDRVMVFNATFNNSSVLLVEETGENRRPVTSRWQTSSHNGVSSTPRHERDSNSQL